MGEWPVVAASLCSAFAFAVATSLKHVSASQVPDAQTLHPRAIGQLIRATLSHPLWLGGIVADAVALSLQIVALHLGALAVVQPLLISGLLFALLLRQGTAGRISRREIGWGVIVTAALTGFLLLAGTAGHPVRTTDGADRAPAIAAAIIGVLLAGICVALGRRQRSGGRSAALLGIAVGATYAATAALLKAATDIALRGPVALALSWQIYTLIALGAGGLLLNQLAFQAGPLTASLPAIATVDPLLSIAIGVLIYDERIRHGPVAGAGLGLLLLVLGVSVIALTRVPQSALTHDQPPPR